ncbi:MAG: amidase [Dethiobacter sp.]|jgi:aspartyl-tRNA(Asn)/glutamyl-tRNA(Gln) amidotransferase subunit A|nr:amidase [Dethiobacter sp.]
METICWSTAAELAAAIAARDVSVPEVVDAYLQRIESVNPKLNAIVTLVAERAVADAKEAQTKIQKSHRLGALHGVPVLIKDNVYTEGIRTTYGSLLYENFVPDTDAILVARLKAAGAIVLGKTNLSEFGLVAITDNVIFGPTKNPWDLAKTPGGSSGGSAAAVAAGLSPLATGNDAGGSIRLPAGFCGIYGLKPSFGRIPSYPRLPVCEAVSHEGPLTRSVADAALMLEAMAGPDDRDRLSLPSAPGDYQSCLKEGVAGLKVAYSPDLGYATVDSEVRKIINKAALVFEELGCQVDEITLELPDMVKSLQIMVLTEIMVANEDRLEEWREKIYPLYSSFFSRVDKFTNKDMARIQFQRSELWHKIRRVFEDYDLLLTPTSAVAAFDSGAGGPVGPPVINGEKVRGMTWMAFAYPFNFTGQPAASVPCGFTAAGLPVGLQIVGRRFDEKTVLMASAAFEDARPWREHHPPV